MAATRWPDVATPHTTSCRYTVRRPDVVWFTGVYSPIVNANALLNNSDRFVPRTKSGFYKHWWNERLDELKQASVVTHNLWKRHGRPRSGEIFTQMKTALIAYKKAIKASEVEDNMYISNDLHELLMEKDMMVFWKLSRRCDFDRDSASSLSTQKLP